MATAATDDKGSKGEATPPEGGTQQQAKAPEATPKPPEGGQPAGAAAKPPEGGAPPEKKPAEPHRLKADEEIPDDAVLITLSPKDLKKRLNKVLPSALREQFGTDDPAEIKKKLDRAAELEAKEEERRVAALSEEAKLKERAEKAEQRAQAAEERAQAIYDAQEFTHTETRFSKIAAGIIDGDYIDHELDRLSRWLNSDEFTPETREKVTDKQVREFFEERVKAKPKLAADFDEKKAPARKAAMNNGANDDERPAAAKTGDGPPATAKTARPGRANSMNRQEVKQETQAALASLAGSQPPRHH